MTVISENVYFDVLDNIVNKYSDTVPRTIKMKPIDITSDFYAEHDEDSNKKDPKFKVVEYVRISKYKKIFAKGYTPLHSTCQKKFLLLVKLKRQFLRLMLLVT